MTSSKAIGVDKRKPRPAPKSGQAADEVVGVTRAESAYLRIRAEVISGKLKAGEPLRLQALRDRYGFSYSPLREALKRLEAERLVDLSALRGFRVAGISLQKMWDSIETRCLIEGEGVRRSIALGRDEWEVSILGAFHSLSRQAERLAAEDIADRAREEEELETRHWAFHRALFSECNSEWLMQFAEQLYAQTERYSRMRMSTVRPGQTGARDMVSEHRSLMKAVLDRDADLAVGMLKDHYGRTGKLIEDQVKAHGLTLG